jgi:hypothetical protein
VLFRSELVLVGYSAAVDSNFSSIIKEITEELNNEIRPTIIKGILFFHKKDIKSYD